MLVFHVQKGLHTLQESSQQCMGWSVGHDMPSLQPSAPRGCQQGKVSLQRQQAMTRVISTSPSMVSAKPSNTARSSRVTYQQDNSSMASCLVARKANHGRVFPAVQSATAGTCQGQRTKQHFRETVWMC